MVRGRAPKLENYDKVFEALHEGPKTWSELRECTGIPERTLTAILDRMSRKWKIAVKRDDGRWALITHERIYGSFEEWEQARVHSEKLISAMDVIRSWMRGGVAVWAFIELLKNRRFREMLLKSEEAELLITPDLLREYGIKPRVWPSKTKYEMAALLLQHIQTGYPDLFRSIAEVVARNRVLLKAEMELASLICENYFKEYDVEAKKVIIRLISDEIPPLQTEIKFGFKPKIDFAFSLITDAMRYLKYHPNASVLPLDKLSSLRNLDKKVASHIMSTLRPLARSKDFIEALSLLIKREKELMDMENRVEGRLLRLESMVRAGNPLNGVCDACKGIKIKPI
mgnify:CR=1 FL=1